MKLVIKTIFFDIGGVYVKGNLASIIKKTSKQLNKDAAGIEKILREFSEDLCNGKMSQEDYFSDISGKLGMDIETIKKLWACDEMLSIDYEVQKIILELKEKGYTVGTITDIGPFHLGIHMEKGTYSIFDFAIDSVNAKFTKLNKEIYLQALSKTDALPDECVMIDDLPRKLIAARELGIHTIVFENAGKLRNDLQKLGVKV